MKVDRELDVLVIGAGPGGLAATARLQKDGARTLLIDAGRTHTRRLCPVDQMRACHGCRGVCNVISGFGGSIHYGDGVKLSMFPSGRRLAELLGADHAHQLGLSALEILCGEEVPKFTGFSGPSLPVAIKDFPVAVLTSAEVRRVVERLHTLVVTSPKVELLLGTQAVSVQPRERGGFAVEILNGNDSSVVGARQVVAAVGRRGQRWWANQVRTLGLRMTPPTVSVGVRFEAPLSLLRGGALLHEDFKTTIVRSGVKIKTFCFCAGMGGGRVKFTDYGDHTLLDGHVIPEAGTTDIGNFALMAQLRGPDGAPRDGDWIEENVLSPYRALRPPRPGKPVLQWYPDWRRREFTCTNLDQFRQLAGHPPSLADLALANLASILPQDVHSAITNSFEELLPIFSGQQVSDEVLRQVGVVGLELEGQWDELILDRTMETSMGGLFAVGDCAGIAQGILQAATSGVAAAEHILAHAAPARRP